MDTTKKASINTYRKTDVLTASKETVLLMLYGGAIRFTKQAIEAAKADNTAERGKYTSKVQEIINELRSTLNFEVGGALAENLDRLYVFISRCLVQSTLDKGVEPLHEVLKVLETLNAGWEQAIANLKKEQAQK